MEHASHTAANSATVDPVCGMAVDGARDPPHTRFNGREWYFCCVGCRDKFLADPRRYLRMQAIAEDSAASPTALRADPATASLWICPMHPQIRLTAAAPCPICGMALEPAIPSSANDTNPELQDFTRRLWLAASLALPLFLISMGPKQAIASVVGASDSAWLQGLLATPIVLGCGWPLLCRGAASLRTGHLNMFTLIGLGVTSAFCYSLVALLAPSVFPRALLDMHGRAPLYFETSGVVITLVLMGQVLELRARAATGRSIRALLDLQPPLARLVSEFGPDRDVALAQVRVGDHLRIRPGEKVPVDARILEGSSYIDESLLTGEPMPRHRLAGDVIFAGTINGEGSLLVEATALGEQALLGRIVRAVYEAQRSHAPIQNIVDRVSSIFVPAILGIAVLTFATWYLLGPSPHLPHALLNAMAVLVIACPCALGLAVPISMLVGTTRAARAGVLFRDAAALQALTTVDTLVIDKTGTLTEGRPRVVAMQAATEISQNDLLRLAASAELGSEHPLARAILAHARDRNVTPSNPTEVQALPGRGISAVVDKTKLWIGSQPLLRELGLDASTWDSFAEQLRSDAASIVFVARADKVLGLIAVSDPLRRAAAEMISVLRSEGLRLVMLTGDHSSTAHAVARHLGEDVAVIADLSPLQKQEKVLHLQRNGAKVAMVGDGINDAPALAAAHVGIAMGSGTDAAIQSAGVVLLGGDLAGAVRALRIARATMRNIRENLFFSFVFNLLGVSIAAGALYPFFGMLLSPMIAGAAMAFSSVTVIGNALRLNTTRI